MRMSRKFFILGSAFAMVYLKLRFKWLRLTHCTRRQITYWTKFTILRFFKFYKPLSSVISLFAIHFCSHRTPPFFVNYYTPLFSKTDSTLSHKLYICYGFFFFLTFWGTGVAITFCSGPESTLFEDLESLVVFTTFEALGFSQIGFLQLHLGSVAINTHAARPTPMIPALRKSFLFLF